MFQAMMPTVRASSSSRGGLRGPSRRRGRAGQRVEFVQQGEQLAHGVFPNGRGIAFGEEMTRTPRRSASATSMLSKPAHRAIHCSSGSASSSAASTFSRERSRCRCGGQRPASTSSRDVVSACRQSMPTSRQALLKHFVDGIEECDACHQIK